MMINPMAATSTGHAALNNSIMGYSIPANIKITAAADTRQINMMRLASASQPLLPSNSIMASENPAQTAAKTPTTIIGTAVFLTNALVVSLPFRLALRCAMSICTSIGLAASMPIVVSVSVTA
jgi:hypothetical protein